MKRCSDKIAEMIKERFTHKDGHITFRDEKGISIEDAVWKMLKNDKTIKHPSLDFSQSFESPEYSNRYISFAYICGDELEHETYMAEEY